MARKFSQFCVYILLLSIFLQTSEIRCLRRLTRRKLSTETDDIRSILSSALNSKPSQMIERYNKRDTASEGLASVDSVAEDNVASESKDASAYSDDGDEDYSVQQQRNLENSEYKRSVEIDPSAEKSANQADLDAYEDSDIRRVKNVAKRDAINEDDYNEDENGDVAVSSDNQIAVVEARAINAKSPENLEKRDNRREADVEEVNSDLNFEKQIEDQIQQRIDSIKEDIKREIERKQQVREIKANNAKYDELELNREDDEVENQEGADSSKRSISRDKSISNVNENSGQSMRSKRSDIEVDNGFSDASKRSIFRDAGATTNELEKSGEKPEFRSKRSDLKETDKNEENKESALVLPVKKRNLERRVTLVEKRNLRDGKRKERSSILIPERGHAEVKDELPGDLTLDSNLRIGRSDTDSAIVSGDSGSARSIVHHQNEAKRYRRDMVDELENDKGGSIQNSFLFARRQNPDCRTRRRRNREREKARKHPRHSRRHRAVRESSMDDEEAEGARDKRAMSLDEDVALEYKESFGGLQSDTGGALGRFKRIRRSSKIS